MDAFLQSLAQEEWRVGTYYPSPAHLINAMKGQYGRPYTEWPGGIPLQGMLAATVGAPDRVKDQRVYKAAGIQQTAVLGTGQAPTRGIYTGVEDSCNG